MRSALAAETPTSSAPTRPGPTVAGNCVDALLLDACFHDRLSDHRVEEFQMGLAGDLRHHAAVLRVQVDLARHDGRQDVVATITSAAAVCRSSSPCRARPCSHRQRRLSSFGLQAAEPPEVGRRIDVVAPHDDGVLDVLVVPLANAGGARPKRRYSSWATCSRHLRGTGAGSHDRWRCGRGQRAAASRSAAGANRDRRRCSSRALRPRRTSLRRNPPRRRPAPPRSAGRRHAPSSLVWNTPSVHGFGYTLASM